MLLLAGLLLGADSGRAGDDDDSAEPAAAAPLGAEITIDAAAQKRAGIELATPPIVAQPRLVRGYGSVIETALLADTAGAYDTAAAQLRATHARLAASQAGLERTRRLYRADQNVSKAELETATASFGADEAADVAAAAQLRIASARAVAVWGPALAARLDSGDAAIARLLDGRDRLIQATLPEAAAPVRSATIDGSGGRLTYLSPAGHADPRVPGASLLFSAPADGAPLPGATVTLLVGTGDAVDGMAVPESAVVRWQGFDWIYVGTGPAAFARRRIETDRPVDGGGYLVTGLKAGTIVVVHGAQLVLSQELKAQGPAGDSD
jgi:hypothetical protein